MEIYMCSWLEKPNITNILNFPKLLYLVNALPLKNINWLFYRTEKMKKSLE